MDEFTSINEHLRSIAAICANSLYDDCYRLSSWSAMLQSCMRLIIHAQHQDTGYYKEDTYIGTD